MRIKIKAEVFDNVKITEVAELVEKGKAKLVGSSCTVSS